jgi:hypothetical protein
MTIYILAMAVIFVAIIWIGCSFAIYISEINRIMHTMLANGGNCKVTFKDSSIAIEKEDMIHFAIYDLFTYCVMTAPFIVAEGIFGRADHLLTIE